MNKIKKILCIMTFITLASACVTGCEKKEASGSSEVIETEIQTKEDQSSVVPISLTETYSEYFSDFDLSTDYNDVTANIQLNGNDVKITGENASFKNKTVSITAGGTYLISGKLDDGQIHVNSSDEENVHIVFNGVDIKNSSSSPVYIENAKNTAITLVKGTENNLSDTENYEFSSDTDNEPDAVIFSKDDLSFNGIGTLNINAEYNEGITTKNDLRIAGGNFNINSVGNSIKGKDSVVIQNAQIKINSGEDGIKSTETDQTDKGFIVFESGTFDITSALDAVDSENFITINDGNFNIKTGNSQSQSNNNSENVTSDSSNKIINDDLNSDTNQNNNTQFGFGRDGKMAMDGNSNKTIDSEKAFKSSNTITFNGGNINANSADDCIHSSENVEIKNGNFILNTLDDGIHSDSNINIDGGNITIESSYEGVEGKVININSGEVKIHSTDDGFNASNGSEEASNDPMSSSPECELNINGGNIYVNADGDGLDSNGSININAGTVLVDGPTNDGNGSLDSGTEINVNGGILVAAGSSGMAEVPSENSKQYSIAAAFSQNNSPSTLFYITDKNQNVIAAYSPSKEYSSIIVSTPDIADSEEYSVYIGGTTGENNENGFTSEIDCSGGELVENVTISEKVTQVGTGNLGQMGGGKMGHNKIDGNMTPPDGGNGSFPSSENMTPPDGGNGGFPNGENMTPPDGGNGGFPNGENMTPPDGGNSGFPNGENMTPPDGGNSGFQNGGNVTRSDMESLI